MAKLKIFLRKGYWLFITILFYNASAPVDDHKITYLSNCGFLYGHETKKILIDPFGTEFGNFFYLPSEGTKNKIIEGTAPFDGVDLLLITHIHRDHFNPFLTERFLLNNPDTKAVCPPQAYTQMKDSCLKFAQIKEQILSPQMAINESKKIKVNDITVTVIKMQHGTDRSLEGVEYSDYTDYEKTENFGYLIDFGKKNIFHQGDACLKINKKALSKVNSAVDIAHLGFFDWDTASFNIVRNELNANWVIFMHGTKPGKELEKEHFKNIIPKLVFFKHELESKIFN